MARYKTYDYAQTMLVAVSLAEQLEPGTLEHTIHYERVKRGQTLHIVLVMEICAAISETCQGNSD